MAAGQAPERPRERGKQGPERPRERGKQAPERPRERGNQGPRRRQRPASVANGVVVCEAPGCPWRQHTR